MTLFTPSGSWHSAWAERARAGSALADMATRSRPAGSSRLAKRTLAFDRDGTHQHVSRVAPASPFRTLRPIASLLAGSALLPGVDWLDTVLPLRGVGDGGANALLGGLTPAHDAMYRIDTLTLAQQAPRIGCIRAIPFCTAGIARVVVLHAFSRDPRSWVVRRLLAAVLPAGLAMLIESWLNASARAPSVVLLPEHASPVATAGRPPLH